MLGFLRNIGAVLAGIGCGGIVVAIIQWLGRRVYPLPPELEKIPPDIEALERYVETAPMGAMLFVFGSWLAGPFVGAIIASMTAKRHSVVPGGVVVGIFLAASIGNMLNIPHPAWFWPGSIVGVLVSGCTGIALTRLSSRPTRDDAVIS